MNLQLGENFENIGKIEDTIHSPIPGSSIRTDIYKLREEFSNKIYALKIIANDNEKEDLSKEAIKREVEILKILGEHPNIVQMYKNKEPYWILLEYLDGVSLDVFLARSLERSTELCIAFFKQLLSALAHLHTKKIIHRDLNPTNVMIMKQETEYVVKLIDFGISKYLSSSQNISDPLSPSKNTTVSMRYVSPDREYGDNKVDSSDDVYALAVIFCDLIFSTSKGAEEIVRTELGKKLDGHPKKKRIIQIIKDCIQLPRSRRPKSAVELLKEISDW